jgi:hypothetical protein
MKGHPVSLEAKKKMAEKRKLYWDTHPEQKEFFSVVFRSAWEELSKERKSISKGIKSSFKKHRKEIVYVPSAKLKKNKTIS